MTTEITTGPIVTLVTLPRRFGDTTQTYAEIIAAKHESAPEPAPESTIEPAEGYHRNERICIPMGTRAFVANEAIGEHSYGDDETGEWRVDLYPAIRATDGKAGLWAHGRWHPYSPYCDSMSFEGFIPTLDVGEAQSILERKESISDFADRSMAD